jgi:3D (Asp-Asp-Asp) domain-containing protein
MLISRSTRRKIFATAVAAVSFALLYEVTALDSQYAARQAELRQDTAPPEPGARLRFSATAYCKGTKTKSGVNVRSGIAAADPELLPVGSVVRVESLGEKWDGIYTILDTGPKVKGRHIDIYIWSCYEALDLGRRRMSLTVLRLGWNPQTSKATLVDRLFRQRETTRDVRLATPATSDAPDTTPAAPVSTPPSSPPREPGGS